MVGAIHGQRGSLLAVEPPPCEHAGEVAGPAGDLRGIVHESGGVAVAAGQILGADRGAVRRLPGKGMAVHGFRNAAEHARVGQPGTGQDLGHLGDVAEHVGQVADRHRAAQLRAAAQPAFQVTHDVLAGAQELVEQDLPRTHRQASGPDEGDHLLPPFRADLQVIVDRGELPVEGEPLPRVALHPVEHVVEQGHQSQPEPLERLVPLPVPVRVWHHDDLGRSGHRLSASPPIAAPVSSP
jgi:hypothetical protein